MYLKRVVAFTIVTYSSWWIRRVASQDGCEYAGQYRCYVYMCGFL